MAGRNKKPQAQIDFEAEIKQRLEDLREANYPKKKHGIVGGRSAFSEDLGVAAPVYEKWEQRGSLSAYAAALICKTTGISAGEFLGIEAGDTQRPPSQKRETAHTREALRHAAQYDELSQNRKEIIDALMDDWLNTFEKRTKKKKTRPAHEPRSSDTAAN